MIALWVAHALAADCVQPAIVRAPEMGSDEVATCLHADVDVGARLFTRFPDTGLSRGIDLNRFRGELGFATSGASARFSLLPARSGGDDGYIGIQGEAIVPRFQLAEARYDIHSAGFSVAAGLVDDIALMPGQGEWTHVAFLRPILTDRGWTSRSDVGGWASWTAPGRWVTATASVTSGEGANRRERNNGLDTTGVLIVRPTGTDLVQFLAWGREGSVGLLQARNHRAGFASYLDHDLVGAGVEAILGWGLGGDGALDPGGVSLWARTGRELPVVGFGRLDLGSDARSVPQTAERTLLAGVGPHLPFEPDGPASLVLAYEGRSAQPGAAPVAGATATQHTHTVFLQLTSRVQGSIPMPEVSP